MNITTFNYIEAGLWFSIATAFIGFIIPPTHQVIIAVVYCTCRLPGSIERGSDAEAESQAYGVGSNSDAEANADKDSTLADLSNPVADSIVEISVLTGARLEGA